MRYKHSKERLTEIVKNSYSIAEVCRSLNIRPIGGNYKTLKVKFKEFGIDYSHFTGQGWSRGKVGKGGKKITLESVLTIDSYYSSHKLKQRLISQGIKEHKCEICLGISWNNKPMPIELDHINGNNTDNRIENLRILCPNCHSQTSNYRGKNKLSALSEKREVEYRKFRETYPNGNPEPSLNTKEGAETRHGRPKAIKPTCLRCDNKCRSGAKYCSALCYKEHTRSKIPKVPEILEAFKVHKNFVQVGKHFNVTDNAVRKWCESYGIMEMVKV